MTHQYIEDKIEDLEKRITELEKPTYEITAELNLEKIVAESREVAQTLNEFADTLEQIEKKYVKPQENKICCNCADEEITKSFIEDVEAVKDLLPETDDNRYASAKEV